MSYEVEVGRLFSVPLKRTQDVDLVKPIKKFLKNADNEVSCAIDSIL